MPDRRKTRDRVTPAYEDNGLFQAPVRSMTVGLVPQLQRNSRKDLVVRAFAPGGELLQVVFAGRRVKQAKPIEDRLKSMLFNARANAVDWTPEAVDTIQLMVQVEGVWRPRFWRDKSGWERRQYHLIAARWAILDDTGPLRYFGEVPLQSSGKTMDL